MSGERTYSLDPRNGLLVDRVDRPSPGLYAFGLRDASSRFVVLVAAGPPRRAPAWAIVDERPRGDAADGEVRGLRERLEGARIERVWRNGSRLGFSVAQGAQRWWIEASSRGLGVVPAMSDGVLPQGETLGDVDIALARQRGESLVAEHAILLVDDERTLALRALRQLRHRLVRRCAAITKDGDAVSTAEERARHAALFVPAAARAPRGATRLAAIDWSRGDGSEGVEVELVVDPARTAREQLDAIFARARRLRGGLVHARRRMDDAELALLMIDEASTALANANADGITQTLRTLRRDLPGDIRLDSAIAPALVTGESGLALRRGRGGHAAERAPFRAFQATSGEAIWVGRSSRDNDQLTVRIARSSDLWLHVKGFPGAHVIVRRDRPSLEADALVDAATLAAHFSDRRAERIVDVAYCERRYVQKRRGSAPGQVEVLRESVIAVRIEPARLERLLASENRSEAPGGANPRR